MSIIKKANLHGTIDFSELLTKDALPPAGQRSALAPSRAVQTGRAGQASRARDCESKQLSFDFDPGLDLDFDLDLEGASPKNQAG